MLASVLTRFDPLVEDGVVFGTCLVQNRVVVESSLTLSGAEESDLAGIIADFGVGDVAKTEVFFCFADETCLYAVSQNDTLIIAHYPKQSDSSLVSHAARNVLTATAANAISTYELSPGEPSAPANPWQDRTLEPTGDGVESPELGAAEASPPRIADLAETIGGGPAASDGANGFGQSLKMGAQENSMTDDANFVGLDLGASDQQAAPGQVPPSPVPTPEQQVPATPVQQPAEQSASMPAQVGGLVKKQAAAGAERESIAWCDFRVALEGILSNVIGDGQASQMVKRHMGKYEINEMLDYPVSDLGTFGEELLARIPNKPKRQILTNEFQAYLKG